MEETIFFNICFPCFEKILYLLFVLGFIIVFIKINLIEILVDPREHKLNNLKIEEKIRKALS